MTESKPKVEQKVMPQVNVKLAEGVKMPAFKSKGAGAFDLTANQTVYVRNVNNYPCSMVGTGVYVSIPKGYQGLLTLRSGFATKTGLIMPNGYGLIDSDYRGEIKVPLMNTARQIIQVPKGIAIAQLMIIPVPEVSLVQVKELDKTERGEGGFGSTDRKPKGATKA